MKTWRILFTSSRSHSKRVRIWSGLRRCTHNYAVYCLFINMCDNVYTRLSLSDWCKCILSYMNEDRWIGDVYTHICYKTSACLWFSESGGDISHQITPMFEPELEMCLRGTTVRSSGHEWWKKAGEMLVCFLCEHPERECTGREFLSTEIEP